MKIWAGKWKEVLKDKKFLISFLIGFFYLCVSLYINFLAGNYATEKASLPVTDIILSNTRAYDVDLIFIYGPLVLFIFVTALILHNPKRIPFTLKSISLFTVIRSVFISLTHLGPFPTEAITMSSNFISKFTFGGDLFFSGHTGLAFLMALLFWKNKTLRYIFLAYSVFIGVVVLLGHYHYSIDVLAAFFITYSIYHISVLFFKKDQERFLN